jgi:hypothetical protein
MVDISFQVAFKKGRDGDGDVCENRGYDITCKILYHNATRISRNF